METRETKDMIDTIKTKSQKMSANIAGLRTEVEKTNDLLKRIVDLLEEDARRTRIKRGH